MRGKRGGGGPPLNLFSFQDIITSVMGILLFVVLMMSLQTQMVADAVVQNSPSEPIPPAIRAASSRQSIAQIESKIHQLRVIMAQSSAETRDRIVKLRTRLQALYDEIRELNDRTFASYQEAIERVKENSVLAEGIKNEQQVLKLRKELEDAKLVRRFRYEVNREFPRQPLIVELDRDGMRVATSPVADDTIVFSGNESIRLTQLRTLLKSFSKESYYVLFVMKPSAMTRGTHQLMLEIEKMGYQYGEDIIPEDWTTMFGESQ